jgi:NAD(P)-dependent dehydrogenase (short-subunit alcohol dehydrogenase family)
MKVNDKVIVVTGGGGGLGQALVLNLLRTGARVAAVDINEEALKETRKLAGGQNGNLTIHVLDITDKVKVLSFPEEVIKTHGAVDGIINNAGIIQPFVHVNDLDYKKIEQVMDINFYGSLYMVKAFLPHLLKRPVAHIVNISSLGGFMPFPGQTIYGASKAALKLLTEGLYAELKETKVNVTIIHPGAMSTKIMSNSGLEGVEAENDTASNSMALGPEKE